MKTKLIRLLLILIVFFSVSISYGQKESKVLPGSDSTAYHGQFDKNEYPLVPTGWTNDYENILTSAQVHILDSIIGNFEKRTTIEIAIVTIDTSYIMQKDFDSLVTTIGIKWGVGKKDKYNGIIIGLSAGLRRIRISNGYAIEQILTDTETKNIIDELMAPEFKQADYFEGLKKGLTAIISKLN